MKAHKTQAHAIAHMADLAIRSNLDLIEAHAHIKDKATALHREVWLKEIIDFELIKMRAEARIQKG